jgi:hypothetical protein
MAYEVRGTKRYYYRGVWQNGRVRKIYVGAGAAGRQAAELQAETLAKRAEERTQRQGRMDKLQASCRQLEKVSRKLNLVLFAFMVEAGFYNHHGGEWRKRHGVQRRRDSGGY